MKIEEKEAVVRRLFPGWLVSGAVLLFGGFVVLVVFHSDPSWYFSLERTVWIMVAIWVIVSYVVGQGNQSALLQKVQQWHRDEEGVKDDLERAAADYLVLFLLLPSSPDIRVSRIYRHGTWEIKGLAFLAKQVQLAAENQRVVLQSLGATFEEEEAANRCYSNAAQKFYSTRDDLIVRGSEYAKSLLRWSDALK